MCTEKKKTNHLLEIYHKICTPSQTKRSHEKEEKKNIEKMGWDSLKEKRVAVQQKMEKEKKKWFSAYSSDTVNKDEREMCNELNGDLFFERRGKKM